MMLEDDDEKVRCPEQTLKSSRGETVLKFWHLFQVPYQIGEVFIQMSQDEVQENMEKTKDRLCDEVAEVEAKADTIKTAMSDLKTHLYAKFGNSINLEADDEWNKVILKS